MPPRFSTIFLNLIWLPLAGAIVGIGIRGFEFAAADDEYLSMAKIQITSHARRQASSAPEALSTWRAPEEVLWTVRNPKLRASAMSRAFNGSLYPLHITVEDSYFIDATTAAVVIGGSPSKEVRIYT